MLGVSTLGGKGEGGKGEGGKGKRYATKDSVLALGTASDGRAAGHFSSSAILRVELAMRNARWVVCLDNHDQKHTLGGRGNGSF